MARFNNRSDVSLFAARVRKLKVTSASRPAAGCPSQATRRAAGSFFLLIGCFTLLAACRTPQKVEGQETVTAAASVLSPTAASSLEEAPLPTPRPRRLNVGELQLAAESDAIPAIIAQDDLFVDVETGRREWIDKETGSVWQVRDGRAIEGPLVETSLSRLAAPLVYWFAWSDIHPNTDVYEIAGGE